MRQQLELRDSYGLVQRYHIESLMTPREFFYPRVALDFYQSMTTRGIPSLTAIHFTIDGHHGILEARGITEALQIPFEPVDPSAFYQWSYRPLILSLDTDIYPLAVTCTHRSHMAPLGPLLGLVGVRASCGFVCGPLWCVCGLFWRVIVAIFLVVHITL